MAKRGTGTNILFCTSKSFDRLDTYHKASMGVFEMILSLLGGQPVL